MAADERELYAAVEAYIAGTWNQATATERSAVGFVMTIYRRRLASSFQALRTTLERHLAMIGSGAVPSVSGLDEDAPDDETADEPLDADEVAEREREALAAEERVRYRASPRPRPDVAAGQQVRAPVGSDPRRVCADDGYLSK